MSSVVSDFWKDRRVLVTGHTGFKGAWLTLWLRLYGAHVSGVATEPDTSPSLLEQFSLIGEIDHQILDIRDADQLSNAMITSQPEIVFHLAAQPLVRASYLHPVDTWSTNVMGTINVMESIRTMDTPVVGVFVTTDKVYLNREWQHGYREHDPLGGHDPYSSSKAAAEIAVNSWRQSFFTNPFDKAIATARAGNVLGGGDWAQDRIFPDIIRSLRNGHEIGIRNPAATRPWQHVLEPLHGYMQLAERMKRSQESKETANLELLASAWNFGPLPEANRTVEELVDTAFEFWPGTSSDRSDVAAVHEATFLGLSIDKACRSLNWYPQWSFRDTIRHTVDWYRQVHEGGCPRAIAEQQIKGYPCSTFH